MEEPDYIEKTFHDALQDLSGEPPQRVWERIHRDLHPDSTPLNIWEQVIAFPPHAPRLFRTGIAFIIVTVLLFLTFLYFGNGDRHAISGHAYAGEGRLCRGTAFLFKVNDKVAPIDSIEHFRSVMIDDRGYFRFPRIAPGKYLLRISPDAGSGQAGKYEPSWYDQDEKPDSAHLIVLGSTDFNADVHLIERK